MSDVGHKIINLEDRRRAKQQGCPIVKKLIDGKVIDCVNLDALNPIDQQKFLAQYN